MSEYIPAVVAAFSGSLLKDDTGAFPPPRIPGHILDRIASGAAHPAVRRPRRKLRRKAAPRAT